jgi:hypothetical protein
VVPILTGEEYSRPDGCHPPFGVAHGRSAFKNQWALKITVPLYLLGRNIPGYWRFGAEKRGERRGGVKKVGRIFENFFSTRFLRKIGVEEGMNAEEEETRRLVTRRRGIVG